MTVKLRALEAQAVIVGSLVGALLGVLSASGAFAPLSCPLQGLAGLLGSAGVGLLSSQVALRRSPQPLVRGILVYTVLVVLSTMMMWPIIHTALLLARG